MTITHTQQLHKALKTTRPFSVYKQRNQNIAAGQWSASFQNGTIPAIGATPTATAAVLSSASTGAIPFVNPVSPQKAYLGELTGEINTQFLQGYELHDLLVHQGGLNATLTTAQTVTGFDLQTLAGTSNLSERYGLPNYAEVTWWFNCHNQLGSTAVTFNVSVTYHDGTTGTLPVTPGGTYRPARMFPIASFIPVADTGKYIRAITSVTLSATTGTAGNFGFIATRYIGTTFGIQNYKNYKAEWPVTGLERIYSDSCLNIITHGGGVNTSYAKVNGKIIYG